MEIMYIYKVPKIRRTPTGFSETVIDRIGTFSGKTCAIMISWIWLLKIENMFTGFENILRKNTFLEFQLHIPMLILSVIRQKIYLYIEKYVKMGTGVKELR